MKATISFYEGPASLVVAGLGRRLEELLTQGSAAIRENRVIRKCVLRLGGNGNFTDVLTQFSNARVARVALIGDVLRSSTVRFVAELFDDGESLLRLPPLDIEEATADAIDMSAAAALGQLVELAQVMRVVMGKEPIFEGGPWGMARAVVQWSDRPRLSNVSGWQTETDMYTMIITEE